MTIVHLTHDDDAEETKRAVEASDIDSSFITGQVLPALGGVTG